MLAIFASLLAVASAAPQLGYPFGYGYPVQHQYIYSPQHMPVYSVPSVYPARSYYPGSYLPVVAGDGDAETAQTRGLFGIASAQEEKGTLSLNTASGYTVEGRVNFYQNIFTGSNSYFKAYLKGTSMEGKEYTVGLAATCTGAVTTLATVKAPSILINGFYYGPQTTTAYNIDGTDGKTDLTGLFFVITDSTGTVVGCSTALAA